MFRSTAVSHAVTRTAHDRVQVEPVGGPVAGIVAFEPGCTPLDQPDRAEAVTTGGVREPDTDLGEALPQVPLPG